MVATDTADARPFSRQPWWWCGVFFMFFFSFGDFAALAFISQSVAAPLGGITMVSNVVLSWAWLGEDFTRRDGFGVGVIVAGLALIGTPAALLLSDARGGSVGLLLEIVSRR